MIDDAIVVIENIDRQLKKKLKPTAAVAAAMEELVGPVTSSTATTVAVFLPLGQLSGVAGQFFLSLTITLAAAVIFSLVLAFTLTPLFAAQWLRGDQTHEKLTIIARLDAWYALGAGSGLQKPLAIAVIGGLSLSAIFTLIFVPVIFRLIAEFNMSKAWRKILHYYDCSRKNRI